MWAFLIDLFVHLCQAWDTQWKLGTFLNGIQDVDTSSFDEHIQGSGGSSIFDLKKGQYCQAQLNNPMGIQKYVNLSNLLISVQVCLLAYSILLVYRYVLHLCRCDRRMDLLQVTLCLTLSFLLCHGGCI